MGERGRPVGTPQPPRHLLAPTDDMRDPAFGEKVRRCRTCGLPDGDYNRLMDFALLLLPGRQEAGTYRLCERCYALANPPPAADQLQLPEAAA